MRSTATSRPDAGFGSLPICIAKTQFSFSTDPRLRGAPEGHVFNVRDVYLSAGAWGQSTVTPFVVRIGDTTPGGATAMKYGQA